MKRLAMLLFACAACAPPRQKEAPSLTTKGEVAPGLASGLASGDAPSLASGRVSAEPSVVDASAAPPHVPTILVLGDSHTYGAFGYRLHEHLAAIGRHAVVSEAAGGATTETYLEDKAEATAGYRVRESALAERGPRDRVHRLRGAIEPLGDLLARHDPEIVVVALGTNRPRAPVAESCETFIQRLVRDRPARRIFWIGPPAVGKDRSETVVASLRTTVEKHAGATFFDSTTVNASIPLPRDNPHFGPDDAKRWADVAFAQIGPRIVDGPSARDR